jgi:DNA-binding GntR family transcriptional regulator
MRAPRPASLAELAAARLRQEIVEGAFAFGEPLSETKIARRYEVSRTPVREAFARLELEGLVRSEAQLGTFVFTMDRAEFAQISEVRSALEIAALTAAASQRRDALIADWRRLAAEMTAAIDLPDPAAYSAADGAFHEAIFAHAGNRYFDAARQPFAARMAAIRNRLGATPHHIAKSYAEHLALLAHVERGEITLASALLERHIRHKGATFWSMPEAAPRPHWRRAAELESR